MKPIQALFRKISVLTLWIASPLVMGKAAFSATSFDATRWRPPDIAGTPHATIDVLARARHFEAPSPAERFRRLHLTLRADHINLPVEAFVRGADVRFDVSIGGAAYAMGRISGKRWRRTPNGVTRIVRSDVQGDDLDRWPIAPFNPKLEGCTAIGMSANDDVIACRDDFDDARFLYISPSGRIEREAMSEGSRLSTFRFHFVNDVRPMLSGWSIEGDGGHADVSIDDDFTETLTPAVDLASITVQQPSPFSNSSGEAVRISSSFAGNELARADVRVNGRLGHFLIDDGTAQLLLDAKYARRVGITITLGHGVATTFDIGPLHGRNVAIGTVDLGQTSTASLALRPSWATSSTSITVRVRSSSFRTRRLQRRRMPRYCQWT